jgi:dolichyl-phosphate-mannose--protein O-mannosyl transferase
VNSADHVPPPITRRIPALDLALAGAVTVLAGAIRFVRLGVPPTIIPLDETYYAKDAAAYLRHGSEDGFAVHPPVGKWLIGAGIKIFGNDAFGWRVAAALFGTLSVLVLYLLARRLWRSPWIAGAVALLLATDGLYFVQSRIAMLDIFLAFFVLVAFWLLVEDRARAGPDHRGIRWWRIGSATAIGLALATKWSAAPIVPVLLAIAIAWEIGRTRPAAVPEPEAEALPPEPVRSPRDDARRVAVVVASFVLIPIVLYVIAYAPWFFDGRRYTAPRCTGKAGVDAWLCYQREIFDYHKRLKNFDEKGKPIHPYLTRAWSWPWIGRPTAHYFNTIGEEPHRLSAHILGLPNPALWYPAFFLAIPLCAWWALRNRDPTAGVLLVSFAPLYLPWLVTSRPLFMFYMTPAVPFLALLVGHVLHRFRAAPGAKWALAAYAGAALALFVYFYPVLAAAHIPDGDWRRHMWMHVDCLKDTIKVACWI